MPVCRLHPDLEDAMGSTRRTFLKGAGALALAGAVARRAAAEDAPAKAGPAKAGAGKGLTLCNLTHGGSPSLGVRTSRGILDVRQAAKARRLAAPATTDEVLRGVETKNLLALVAEAEAGGKSTLVAEKEARFGPAVASPGKIVMMGLNYRRHIAEIKAPTPTSPMFFNKYNCSLNHHRGTIRLPIRVAKEFDYEVELVVVIGKQARDLEPGEALKAVWGYCTGNDFTARDLQRKTSQFMLGKTPDGFAPLGPWLVSADQVPDPQDLKLECSVNGQVRQSSNTGDMIYSCADLVSYASKHFTLEPGDIIFTGTPEGVIAGKPEAERVWLKAGDHLSCEVGNLGRLEFDLV
jgi:2-keto-4-pentenoate hydratase/2-oxohepta-3-ene-1,7-dioic acid hydratase in catechol pathway